MIKYFSLFSGIGAFEAALDNLDIDFELVGYSEIDKYASKSYSAIHGIPESMNYGDITKIDERQLPKDIDLITYGFPCQDISVAGKQKGLFNEDGSQTRSGLFFEALRIIEEVQPKIAIAENVKNLVGKKFKEQFEIVLSSLEQVGYNNYYKILNSKDYGIPQNRERVFIVSIRKDVDTGIFEFPEGYPLEKRLKDLLEDEVDEKFYITNGNVDKLLKQHGDISNNLIIGGMQKNQSVKTDGVCTTLTSSMGTGGGYVPMVTEPIIRQVCNVRPTKNRTNPNQGRVYDPNYIAPSLNTCGGGNLEPHIVINVGNVNPSGRGQNGQVIDSEGLARTITIEKGEGQKILVREPFIVASRGRNPENPSDRTTGSPTEQRLEPNSQGICNTLTSVQKDNYVVEPPQLRIRKLTPKECFRLMGFDDADFEQAEKVNSNTQLYKQAGNSIVVDVLEELFCMMFDEDGNFFI